MQSFLESPVETPTFTKLSKNTGNLQLFSKNRLPEKSKITDYRNEKKMSITKTGNIVNSTNFNKNS